MHAGNSGVHGSLVIKGSLPAHRLGIYSDVNFCNKSGIEKCSVADPDPHASGTYSWIRNFCYGTSQKMKELINKNAIFNFRLVNPGLRVL